MELRTGHHEGLTAWIDEHDEGLTAWIDGHHEKLPAWDSVYPAHFGHFGRGEFFNVDLAVKAL